MIDGVKTKELKPIADERGWLMEVLRCDDEVFEKFGQAYITTTYPDVVKAWHQHKKQTDVVACIKGSVKVVLYDARKDSPTHGEVNEFTIGEDNHLLVVIPPGVYHGWTCISKDTAFILSVPTLPYNRNEPDEFRLAPDSEEIPYKWVLKPGLKHG